MKFNKIVQCDNFCCENDNILSIFNEFSKKLLIKKLDRALSGPGTLGAQNLYHLLYQYLNKMATLRRRIGI